MSDKYIKYKYQASGMFRDSSVPKGITADLVHADELVAYLRAERDELQKCRKEEKKCQIDFAIRMLGQEAYDNSPCQAHPLELVEFKVSEVLAEHKRLISRITDKAIRNRGIT
jgi:hypothetical protein